MEEAKTKKRGRQKIEIKKLEDESRRLVTFSKRRQGLFKKATELSTMCGARTAVVVFSKTSKLYSCGDVDSIFDQYLTGEAPESDNETVLSGREEEKKPVEVEEETRFWWEKTAEEWLMGSEAAVKELKKNVEARLEEVRRLKAKDKAASSSSSSSSSSLPLSTLSNGHDHDQGLIVEVDDQADRQRCYDEFVDAQYNYEDDLFMDFGGFDIHGGVSWWN